jgi:hypothetical protein
MELKAILTDPEKLPLIVPKLEKLLADLEVVKADLENLRQSVPTIPKPRFGT